MLFDSWHGIDYKISSRKLVMIIYLSNFEGLLPYASMGNFKLFSIDKDGSYVLVLDPLSVLSSLENKIIQSHN
jgi:hypothetical protein